VKARIVVALASVLFISSAYAGPTEEARDHYQKATSHFAVGEFAEAAAEYQAAFKAKPDPALLYDAAQAYRLANNPEKALILYRNYLQLYPSQPNIGEVQAQIEKLKDAIAAADKAKTAPPTGTTEPKRIESEATQAAPPSTATEPSTPLATASPEVATHSERTPAATPLYKKWWLWTVVGVVVVGGVVTATVLATRSSGSWSNEPDVGPGSQNALRTLQVRW